MGKCLSCKRELDISENPFTMDCGGDCLACTEGLEETEKLFFLIKENPTASIRADVGSSLFSGEGVLSRVTLEEKDGEKIIFLEFE